MGVDGIPYWMGKMTTADRILALKGKPGFETWEQIGEVLRVSRGSAYSLAHGLKKADAQTLKHLEDAEFRVYYLPQAIANLSALIGREAVMPKIFLRTQGG
jgi:hypothetical protein